MDLSDINKKLMQELDTKNLMALPKLTKININIGMKEAVSDKNVLEKASQQLIAITGQKPKVTRSKTSIANFKVREGDAVGLTVTLRSVRMWDFLTKLVNIALPRVRDFQGVPDTAFDGAGNYTLGLSEQIVFPEIDYSKIDKIRGLEITFVIKNSDAKMSKRLLELFGMPFRKPKAKK